MQRIVIAFVAVLAATFAQAQALQPAPDDVERQIQGTAQMLRARCNSDCLTASAACLKAGAAAPEVCDTRAIACLVSCPACSSQYPTCRKAAIAEGADTQMSIMRCTVKVMDCRSEARKAAEAQRAPIVFSGGDGRSMETAVVISGARNTLEGVFGEGYWTWKNHPGWQKTRQSLLNRDGKRYDLITNKLPDGSQAEIYFDITDFFGKW